LARNPILDLRVVDPQPRCAKVTLTTPPRLGYLHVAAADPPRGRTPFPGNSPPKTARLTRLHPLTRQLERLGSVERATVYRAILVCGDYLAGWYPTCIDGHLPIH
jgi:hypothetical protein